VTGVQTCTVPRPSSKRSTSHAARFASSVTASATGHGLDLAQVSAPDPQRLAVVELDGPYAETFVAETPDAVPAQDCRTVDADEARRIEATFEPRNRL